MRRTKWTNLSTALLSGIAVIAIAGAPRGLTKISTSQITETSTPILASKPLPPPAPAETVALLKDLSRLRVGATAAKLVSALQGDELSGHLVFENLSTYEPIVQILKKGVLSFDRRTLRSPNYKEEVGYDVVVYEIRHPLSTVSRVMAYVNDEDQVTQIAILTGRTGDSDVDLVEFTGAVLNSQRQAAWTEAEALFDHELSSASTLMNASVK